MDCHLRGDGLPVATFLGKSRAGDERHLAAGHVTKAVSG